MLQVVFFSLIFVSKNPVLVNGKVTKTRNENGTKTNTALTKN